MKKNYLDFVPVINVSFENKNGIIIYRENKGFINRVLQRILKKPKMTRVSLDEYGTYVWSCIDGRRNIYDIYLLMKKKYKVTPRQLSRYFVTLHKFGFIMYSN